MKTWFTKFRISTALDRRQPLPQAVRDAVARSEELRRFEQDAAAVARALANSPLSAPEPPPSLHAAIMRAVRVAPRPRPRNRDLLSLRRLAATALVALVTLAVWRASTRAPYSPPAPESMAGSVLNLGGQLGPRVPTRIITPLADEWRHLDTDLDRTEQFLLASLP